MGPFTSPNANKNSASSTSSAGTMSIEEIRRVTRQRLIGALILTIIGVVVFSVLLDTAPKPVVEVPIEVVRPLPPEAAAEGIDAAVPQLKIRTLPDRPSKEQVVVKTLPADLAYPVAKTAPSSDAAPVKQANPTTAQARAAVDTNKAVNASSASTSVIDPNARVVLHIGSFQSDKEVQEARAKAQKAGLSTYIQVVDTSKGRFTRVRIGPFENLAAAEKVLPKVKAAGLPNTDIRPL